MPGGSTESGGGDSQAALSAGALAQKTSGSHRTDGALDPGQLQRLLPSEGRARTRAAGPQMASAGRAARGRGTGTDAGGGPTSRGAAQAPPSLARWAADSLVSETPVRVPLATLAAARRLCYRGNPTEAQVTAALSLLCATDGFMDGQPLLVLARKRAGLPDELWLCDGACRVEAALRHVADTPACGAGWRDAPVLYLLGDLAPEAVVRAHRRLALL